MKASTPGWFLLFNDISIFVGYLIPKPPYRTQVSSKNERNRVARNRNPLSGTLAAKPRGLYIRVLKKGFFFLLEVPVV